MKLNMISNYKPPGSFQSILIPTLRSKNTFDMQNTNLLACTVVHYLNMYIILLFIVGLVKMLMLLTLHISGGKQCFFEIVLLKLSLFLLLQTIGRNDCGGSDYPELSFCYCFLALFLLLVLVVVVAVVVIVML